MKSIKMIFVVLAAASIFTGCGVSSLRPFFTEENVVFRDDLLGVWINDSGDKCKFTKSDANHYELLYVDDAPARFEARLVEIGGVTFLDLYPKATNGENALYGANFTPTHTLARVTIGEDSISIAMMDEGWFTKLREQNKLNLAHERLDDGTIVLTAPTRELQAFALKHADDKEAFGDAEVFHRLRPDIGMRSTK